MDNNLFIKNILILIVCVILIHLFLNEFLTKSTCINNKEKFQYVVMDNNLDKNKTKVYLFYADWCGHCKGFKPTWEKLQKDLSNKFEFITMDSEKNKEEITKWDIKGFPTIIKLVGSKAEEYMGSRDEISVKKFLF